MITTLQRYALRPDRTGCTVYDIWTAEPVAISLVVQQGLERLDAQELADLLNNTVDRTRRHVLQ